MQEKRSNTLPEEEKKYEIPVYGSLGLLALGYKGLLAWRSKKAEVKTKMESNPENSNDTSKEG